MDTAGKLEFRQNFLELRDRLYRDRTEIFTDGSKSDHKVAAAAVVDDQFLVCRLPDDSAVYSAELAALWLALKFTLESSNIICEPQLPIYFSGSRVSHTISPS